MRACWLKWVGRDWSISADYIWLNYSGANNIVYITALNGEYATLAWPLRLLTWLLATALAYGLALAMASLVDTLIVEPIKSTIKQHRLKFQNR